MTLENYISKEETDKINAFSELINNRDWKQARMAYYRLKPETQILMHQDKYYDTLLKALAFSSL